MKFSDIIYPDNISCIICGQPITPDNPYSLCKCCYEDLQRLKLKDYFLDEVVLQLKKLAVKGVKVIDNIYIMFRYDGIVKKLVHDIKYNEKTYLGRIFAAMMNDFMTSGHISADYIVPVPMHDKKLHRRGYNQMQLIGDALSKLSGVPVINAAGRVHTAPDMYHLDKEERALAIKGSFKSQKLGIFYGKRLLIIDDVLTTGATSGSLSKEIKKNNPNCLIDLFIISRPHK